MENKNVYCIVNPDEKYLCRGINKDAFIAKGGDVENLLTPYELIDKKLAIEGNESVREGDVIILTKPKTLTMPATYKILRNKQSLLALLSERISAIDHIVHLLGGVEFSAEEKLSYRYDGSQSGTKNAGMDSSGEVPKVGHVSANGSLHANTQVEKKIDIHYSQKIYTKSNGVLSQENYDEAKEIAREHNLLEEPNVKNLIEQRNPQNLGTITVKHYSINVSYGLTENIKLACGIKNGMSIAVGKANISLDNAFEAIIEQNGEYYFEFDAKFPNTQENGEEKKNQQQQANTGTYDINFLKTNLDTLERNITAHTGNIGEIREQIQSLSSEIEQNRIEVLNIQQQQVHTYASEINSLKTDFNILTGSVTAHTEDIGKIREDIQIISSKIEQDCTEALDAQRQQIDTCTSDVNSLKTALVTLTGNVTTHTEDIGKIREEMQTISSKIEQDCTKALDAQRQQIDTCTSNVNSLKTHFDYLQENVTVQQKNIDTIREKIQYIERVNTDCLGQLKSQKEQVDILASEIKSLQGSVINIEKRMEVLRVQYDNQITQVKQQLDRMISQICTSQKEFDKKIESQKVIFSILISVVGIISVASLVLSLVFYYI